MICNLLNFINKLNWNEINKFINKLFIVIKFYFDLNHNFGVNYSFLDKKYFYLNEG